MTRTQTYGISLAAVLCLAAAVCALRAGPAAALSFTPPVQHAVGGLPTDIASADVNGDGRLDIVTSAGKGISVLIATGPGRFAPAITVALEHRPGAIALADIDGDGTIDVATADRDDTVTVLLGDGAGSFVAKGTFPTGLYPTDVVVGDLTGDGVPDVATADHDGDGVSILAGDGTGGLLPPLDLPVGEDCARVVAGDFNLDGKLDLAATRYSWDEYSGFGVLLGDGAGGFSAPAFVSGRDTDSSPHSLVAGRLNNDGAPDLVALYGYEGGSVCSFLGDGLGLFVTAGRTDFSQGLDEASGLAVADLNGDGRGDVVSSGYRPGGYSGTQKVPPGPTRIYIMLNRGGGSLRPNSFLARRTVGELVLADFNRDRRPDLAWTNLKSDNVTVRLNGALPVLTGVSPAQGRTGDVVTLTGRHFIKRGSTVRFGSQVATDFLSWTASHIKVRVPSGTARGSVKVTVTTIMGRSAGRTFLRL